MEIQNISKNVAGKFYYAPAITMAGALSVTPVRMYVTPKDVRSQSRIVFIRIL